MTEFKKRILHLSSGKQIKLFGNSLAIGSSLEIGEGAAPNIFSFFEQVGGDEVRTEVPKESSEAKPMKPSMNKKSTATVSNPHRLTKDEVMEIADYNIRLWMDLKDNIREYGVSDTKVFNQDALR